MKRLFEGKWGREGQKTRRQHALSMPLSPRTMARNGLQRETERRSLRRMSRSSSSSSTLATPGLSALRARNRPITKTPDPTTASAVIRGYLIPMFEAELQAKTDITRSATLGTTTIRGLDPIPGTVFGEMKLSDHLSKELSSLRSELRSLKQQLTEALQSNASALSELDHYKLRCLDLEGHLSLMKVQWVSDNRQLSLLSLESDRAVLSLHTLQESYKQMEESCKTLNSLLQVQYAAIDKLRIKETSQEHTTSLLRMENDIIGERLKGLYFAIEKVADCNVLEAKMSAEFALVAERVNKLMDFVTETMQTLAKVKMERDKLVQDNIDLSGLYTEMKLERDKTAKIAKEKVANLQGNLTKIEEEKEKLTTELAKTEQNFKDLTEEYEKLRQKAKQYRQRRKMYGEEEEKVCKNCQRVFVESENYNWSCRRHQSEFSGEVYWCCGKAGKDTPGCKTSKHESKEEEEEEDENPSDMGKDQKDSSSMHCSVAAK